MIPTLVVLRNNNAVTAYRLPWQPFWCTNERLMCTKMATVSMAKGCLIPKPTQLFELFRPSIRVRNSSTCLLSSCKSSSLNTLNRVVQVGGYPFCLPFTQYLIASLKGPDSGWAVLGSHCSLPTTSCMITELCRYVHPSCIQSAECKEVELALWIKLVSCRIIDFIVLYRWGEGGGGVIVMKSPPSP